MFYLIILKKSLYVYRKKNEAFIPEYIEGKLAEDYELKNLEDKVKKIIEYIAEANNLTPDEVHISVVENSDSVRNEKVRRVLGNKIKATYKITDVLDATVKNLRRQKDLYIDQLGINFDGESYQLKAGRLKREAYSLLAYTIMPNELVKYL